jgi:hypothetical protein
MLNNDLNLLEAAGVAGELLAKEATTPEGMYVDLLKQCPTRDLRRAAKLQACRGRFPKELRHQGREPWHRLDRYLRAPSDLTRVH